MATAVLQQPPHSLDCTAITMHFGPTLDTATPPSSPHSPMAAAASPDAVSDLSDQLSAHSLNPYFDHHPSLFRSLHAFRFSPAKPPTPPSEPISPTSNPIPPAALAAFHASSPVPPSPPSPPPCPSYFSSNVRQQRQRALRQQCSSSHLREISDLVARMVDQGEQCSVGTAEVSRRLDRSSPSASGDDESDDAMDVAEGLTQSQATSRRASTITTASDGWNMPEWTAAGTGKQDASAATSERKSCVSKDARFRKQAPRRRAPTNGSDRR